ncbi:MAG: RNA 2',3'-cyclic phosphodiesterase [Candidatus Omnitrophica bacterium]|nr:RNA 2',3'-cyclic phosphodiesterase [Candidatus Omnitrophota bacterium]
MKNTIRGFIALELSPKLREELEKIQKKLKHLSGEISWTIPNNLHLSVYFLGNISQEQISIVKAIKENIAKKIKSFPIALGVLGVFPFKQEHQVLWAGISSGYSQITQINTLFSKELKAINIKAGDKHFHPHITLARIKSLQNKTELTEIIDNMKLSIANEELHKLVLYKSELNSSGAIYSKISEVELG